MTSWRGGACEQMMSVVSLNICGPFTRWPHRASTRSMLSSGKDSSLRMAAVHHLLPRLLGQKARLVAQECVHHLR